MLLHSVLLLLLPLLGGGALQRQHNDRFHSSPSEITKEQWMVVDW